MEQIHSIISSIRSIRAEYKVEPAKKISATIYGHDLKQTIEENKDAITKLGRLEKLEILEKGEKIPQTASLVSGSVEIYLPLAEIIDIEQEKRRILSEIQKIEESINRSQTKLQDPNFINKAPKIVIERENTLQEKNQETLTKLKKQFKDL